MGGVHTDMGEQADAHSPDSSSALVHRAFGGSRALDAIGSALFEVGRGLRFELPDFQKEKGFLCRFLWQVFSASEHNFRRERANQPHGGSTAPCWRQLSNERKGIAGLFPQAVALCAQASRHCAQTSCQHAPYQTERRQDVSRSQPAYQIA